MSIPAINPIQRITAWFFENWFTILCISLLVFIAFFPKIPLFDIIPGYIVRARLEDLFLGAVLAVFAIQLLRGKVTLKTPITKYIVAYAVIAVVSILSAIFVVKTIPMDSLHIGKMVLHFARRLEYFSLFFLFYNAISKRRHVRMVLMGLIFVLIGVSLYGFGQKYLYWPVYSTMNREFSKGMRLVLTEHARVPSTFGGHYDMSAFVMFLLTMVLSLIFFSKKISEKVVLSLVFGMGFWLLILGASRSSFLAYLLAIGVLVLFVGAYKRSIVWIITRGAIVFGFSLTVMVLFGDLSSRFSQLGLVQQAQKAVSSVVRPLTQRPANSVEVTVDPLDKTDQLPVAVATPVATQSAVSTESGTVSTPAPAPVNLPPDVYKDIPDIKTVTASENGVLVTRVVEVPRIFSDCTYIYGLSACIRFETLWPRAINGFIRNPIVGSGYSTLTKEFKDQFTEAESTDNDFLRTLGEVGALGAIAFYAPIGLFIVSALKKVDAHKSLLISSISFGIIAGSLGMLFNGLYIDVFAASKVAFLYWSVLGLGFAALQLGEKSTDKILAEPAVSTPRQTFKRTKKKSYV